MLWERAGGTTYTLAFWRWLFNIAHWLFNIAHLCGELTFNPSNRDSEKYYCRRGIVWSWARVKKCRRSEQN